VLDVDGAKTKLVCTGAGAIGTSAAPTRDTSADIERP
jgi:hypothetical protein